jgi:hypothetical protein
VRVLKGSDLLDAAEALLELLDLAEDLVASLLAGGLLLGVGELGKLGIDFLGLGHVVEHAGKESTLLGSDLGRWGVVCHSAVTDSPDVLRALDNQVLVHGETTARVLLCGDLVDEVLDQGSEGVTSGPDEKTVWDLLDHLLAVGPSGLGLDVLLSHVLDHGLCADGDGLLLECLLGVVDELLGEHGQDVGEGLDEGDVEVILDLGEPLLQIRMEEVLELTSKLDTGRTATDDDHMQQALLLLVGLVLECGRLAAVHDTRADALGVAHFLQEEAVLAHTGDACWLLAVSRSRYSASRTKGCVLGADTHNEHVEGDLGLGRVALDLRVVVNVDNPLLVVDLGGLGLVVLDGGLLVAQEVADGLHDGAVLNGADGARGQQRGEEEVVARRDDDDVVVLRVELLQQGDGAPAGACRVSALVPLAVASGQHTEHHERLLARRRVGLVLRVAHFVDAVAHVAHAGDGGQLREAPCPAKEAEPPLRLRLCIVRRASDGLAQGNLVLRRARGPARAVGDERRALCGGVGAAAGELQLRSQVRGGEGPHSGRHWADGELRRDSAGSMAVAEASEGSGAIKRCWESQAMVRIASVRYNFFAQEDDDVSLHLLLRSDKPTQPFPRASTANFASSEPSVPRPEHTPGPSHASMVRESHIASSHRPPLHVPCLYIQIWLRPVLLQMS